MAVIKQISVFDGSSWETDNIGADAANIDFANSVGTTASIAGSSNLYTGLSNILPASKLTANRALVTDSSGKLATSNISTTILNTALNGASTVTSIQNQINTLNTNLGEKTLLPYSNNSTNYNIQQLNNGKLKNTTDTLTGNLNIKNTTAAVRTIPSTGITWGIYFQDKNNYGASHIDSRFYTDGYNGIQVSVGDGNNNWNTMTISINKSGNPKVNLSYGAAWLESTALNIPGRF